MQLPLGAWAQLHAAAAPESAAVFAVTATEAPERPTVQRAVIGRRCHASHGALRGNGRMETAAPKVFLMLQIP